MVKTKTIAPVTDDRKTEDMVTFAVHHLTGIAQIMLFATKTTETFIARPQPLSVGREQ